MKKKMLIFLVVIVVLFAALYFVTAFKNKQAVDNNENPYGKEDLEQATIDQLEDPLYQNQIKPSKLDEKLEDKGDLFVYFYSPTCPHCRRTTPVLVPLTKDMGVDMKKLNLLEFESGWNTYGIESTPTVVYYHNGKEIDRINGAQSEEMFRAFFDEYANGSM